VLFASSTNCLYANSSTEFVILGELQFRVQHRKELTVSQKVASFSLLMPINVFIVLSLKKGGFDCFLKVDNLG
jgi:hypothetical protein